MWGNKKTIHLVFIIFLIAFLTGCMSTSSFEEYKKSESIFIKEYTISLNNIHSARELIKSADNHLNYAILSTKSNNYDYENTMEEFETGKENILEAKELLNKAKVKIESLETDNELLDNDLKNRLEQTNILLNISDNLYYLIDTKQTVQEKKKKGQFSGASLADNSYNDNIPKYHTNLKRLSDIENKIDLEWDQDWYPTYKE